MEKRLIIVMCVVSSFSRKDNLVRDEKTHDGNRIASGLCDKTFSFESDLKRHEKNVHRVFPANCQRVEIAPNVSVPIQVTAPLAAATTQQWTDNRSDVDFATFALEGNILFPK